MGSGARAGARYSVTTSGAKKFVRARTIEAGTSARARSGTKTRTEGLGNSGVAYNNKNSKFQDNVSCTRVFHDNI